MMDKQARSLGNRSSPALVLQGSEQTPLEDGRPDRFVGPHYVVGATAAIADGGPEFKTELHIGRVQFVSKSQGNEDLGL